MARRTASKNDLIECPYCGEKYSVTYKHCPFCNEDGTGRWDDPAPEEEYIYEDGDTGTRGGKRLMGDGGGWKGPSVGRIIGTVLSLALIIAAGCIVFSLVRSLVGGKDPKPAPTPSAPVMESAAPSVIPSEEPSTVPSEPAVEPSTPAVEATQAPAPSAPVTDVIQPTAFRLNHSDVTCDHAGEVFQINVTYTPTNARGDITWKSSDPNVASVSWNGLVTAVSPGTVKITASVAGVGTQECIVRCSFKSAATPAATPTPGTSTSSGGTASANGLKLSREDFTLAYAGDSWTLNVSGTGSTPTWSSTNTGVATVDANGKVTAVAKGTCRVKATVDGVTLECIVRCTWQ